MHFKTLRGPFLGVVGWSVPRSSVAGKSIDLDQADTQLQKVRQTNGQVDLGKSASKALMNVHNQRHACGTRHLVQTMCQPVNKHTSLSYLTWSWLHIQQPHARLRQAQTLA